MNPLGRLSLALAWAFALLFCASPLCAETFRVATFNVEGYFDQPLEHRSPKSVAAKAKVRESIRMLKPDVLALQEIGSATALAELRESLKSDGLDFPHWEWVAGFDTNIHVAVISRFPIVARRSRTNENFLLSGRRFRVSRGFAELEVQVNEAYRFTLLAAHLKSKRAVPQADESEMRLEEAKLLRARIDACLEANPELNLIVLGDFNDTPDSLSTKAVIGRGKNKLIDTRPAERHGDESGSNDPVSARRTVAWTHYFATEDSYSRIDFLLLSRGMAREWLVKETFIPFVPNWGVASDHRPIMAAFNAGEQ